MTFATAIRATRQSRGLSQGDIVRDAGVTASAISRFESRKSDFLGKTLGTVAESLNSYFYLAPYVGFTTTEASEYIKEKLSAGLTRSAFRGLIQFSDGLRKADITSAVLLTVTPPELTGDPNFDAAIAALSHYHLNRLGITPHSWITAPSGYTEIDGGAFGFQWSKLNLEDTDPIIKGHGVVLPRETVGIV